ncbi:hypothetical protein [Ralstonia phage Reminis]|uniref:Uncharacterized protein n=1 Tax=Ralstonia phage Reminis TaxID=2662139 RepID=A0A5Q2UAM4_9CAUD|nr:hypothetical protein [Ralstonia phage Reminis]
MSNVERTIYFSNPSKASNLFTDEELREFNKRSRQMEKELSKAAEAGLFLTAADLDE